MPTIFAKQRSFRPSQLRTVAQRRFADAEALAATRNNERAAGAIYLCGYVVEIFLKAILVDRFEGAGAERTVGVLTRPQNRACALVWGTHDLALLLEAIPGLEEALDGIGQAHGVRYGEMLKSICGAWTVYTRYSPQSTTIADAEEMIDKVRSLKDILR